MWSVPDLAITLLQFSVYTECLNHENSGFKELNVNIVLNIDYELSWVLAVVNFAFY